MKDELPPGTILGNQYRVIETLGRGGFGITYKCEDIHLKFIVAVKEYFPDGMAQRDPKSFDVLVKSGSEDMFAWGLKKFLLEGTTLAAIQAKYSSEFIIKILRYWKEHLTAYFAMEFVDGMQIDDFASSDRITSAAQVEALFQSLCLKALKPIHDSNFYHRDIKPANILVRHSNNEPVIIDFGAARQTAGGKSTVALLTPRYSAVEQYASQEDMDDDGGKDICGSFTDIYSLAATFYFIIKGKPPQDAPSRILGDNDDKLVGDSSLSHYSNDFLTQIDWGMQPIPKDRPQTIDEWLHQVETVSKGAPPKGHADKEPAKKQVGGNPKKLSSGITIKPKHQKMLGIAAAAWFIFAISFSWLNDSEDTQPEEFVSTSPPEIKTPESRRATTKKDAVTSWMVGIDAVGWTAIKVLPKLETMQKKPSGSFQLRLHGEEQFRVKTTKGMALTKSQAKNYGGINGEVYLKSVNGTPQKVQVDIIHID